MAGGTNGDEQINPEKLEKVISEHPVYGQLSGGKPASILMLWQAKFVVSWPELMNSSLLMEVVACSDVEVLLTYLWLQYEMWEIGKKALGKPPNTRPMVSMVEEPRRMLMVVGMKSLLDMIRQVYWIANIRSGEEAFTLVNQMIMGGGAPVVFDVQEVLEKTKGGLLSEEVKEAFLKAQEIGIPNWMEEATKEYQEKFRMRGDEIVFDVEEEGEGEDEDDEPGE